MKEKKTIKNNFYHGGTNKTLPRTERQKICIYKD